MSIRLLWLVCLFCVSLDAVRAADERPNILLIVADDLGYADLGAYGSEIETPNIDALARDGVLFTQFHTGPSCSTTRAMLLSGNNNAVAGVTSQHRNELAGSVPPGYEGGLSDRVAPLPRVLRDAGYNTYIAGKWHLGHRPDQSPRAAGFTRSFTMLEGGGSQFNGLGYRTGGATFRSDGEIAEYPDGIYSTQFYTDKLIEYIDADRPNGKPFFAFASYTSPHWPLQVPDDYLDHYRGEYDDGYDALRERRFESLKEAGIIPLESRLPPRNEAIRPWDTLNEEQKKIEARKMELYAAMIDNLDDHIGRLLQYLDGARLLDNTLIVFMGDNGAAAEDFWNGLPYDEPMEYLHERFDNSYDNMGTATSFVSYGAQWAEASSAPYRWRKHFLLQGGIVSPLIISGAQVDRSGDIDSQYVSVTDLAPTFIDRADASYPHDGSVRPMLGKSMAEYLDGNADLVHAPDFVTVFSTRGRALARKGRWKIVTTNPPFDESKFALYDLQSDPGETLDLREEEPEIFAELLAIWRQKRVEYGYIVPLDL